MNDTTRRLNHSKKHLSKLKKMRDGDGFAQIALKVDVCESMTDATPLSFGALAQDIAPIWDVIIKATEEKIEYLKKEALSEIEELKTELESK